MIEMAPERKQAAYVLPVELIRDIKIAAAHLDKFPADVVESACREYLATKSPKRPNHAIATA